MTHLINVMIVTDIDAEHENNALTAEGYTIRAIETWHDHDTTGIIWDAPEIADADLPY